MPDRTTRLLLCLALCSFAAHADQQRKGTVADISDTANSDMSHREGRGNAVKVCDHPRIGGDSPRLSRRGGRNTFATGFYRFRHQGETDEGAAWLDVTVRDGAATLAPGMKTIGAENARAWLLTQVGADLYQIATCAAGAPLCLAPGADAPETAALRLDSCDPDAVGFQSWWLTGLLHGPGAGGWELGSDGLGRMACLTVADDVPVMAPCGDSTRQASWRIEPAAPPAPATADLPETSPDIDTPPSPPADATAYDCENGLRLQARYGDDDQVALYLHGKRYDLEPSIAASGARYETLNGPTAGRKLVWWTKGDSALLIDADPGDNSGDSDTLVRCSAVAD